MRGHRLIPSIAAVLLAGFISLTACRSLSGLSSGRPEFNAPPQQELLLLSPTPAPAVTATDREPQPAPTLPDTPSPTLTVAGSPTPAPTHTPQPEARLLQVTTGGCCPQPTWSQDGRIMYVDKPETHAPAGLWSISIEGDGPVLVSERLGIYSRDMRMVAYPDQGQTFVERLEDGQVWLIPSDGRAVYFSPDGTRLAWTAGDSGPPSGSARRQVWVGQVDGSQANPVVSLYGGGFIDWFPDGRLLINGRYAPGDEVQVYWAFNPADGSLDELARGSRLRGASLSPSGEWLAYQAVFSADPAQDGMWLVNTNTGQSSRLDVFGSYRWRDGSRLLLVPLDAASPNHRILEIEAESASITPLTDPGLTPFKIANGDWSVSPGGNQAAFVSAWDHNIWVLELE